MFHILLGIVLIGIGLAWSLIAGLASLYETGESAAQTRFFALWGLVPIALGVLAIWSP